MHLIRQLDLIAYKTSTGIWAFDHEHQNTVAEALCGGTELVIDCSYTQITGRPPQAGALLPLRLDTEPMQPCSTSLQRIRADQSGTTYRDLGSGMEVWLCPWLEGYVQSSRRCCMGWLAEVSSSGE